MNVGSIATRYSRALFEEARAQSVDKYIYDYLGVLYQNMSRVPEAHRALLNPRIKPGYKFRLLLVGSGLSREKNAPKGFWDNMVEFFKNEGKKLMQDEQTDSPKASYEKGIDLYERFLWLVLKHDRISLMRLIILVYQDLYRKHHNIDHVMFATAVAVDQSIENKVREKIHEKTGRGVELEMFVRPELIGGFWVVIGDRLYDYSYHTRLQNIRKSLWNK